MVDDKICDHHTERTGEIDQETGKPVTKCVLCGKEFIILEPKRKK